MKTTALVALQLALAAHTHAAILFGSEVVSDVIIDINQSTAAATVIGPVIPAPAAQFSLRGLAADPSTGRLWGVGGNLSTQFIYSVNASTAAITPITSTGTDNPNGLAFRPASQTLFFTDNLTNALYSYNVSTDGVPSGGISLIGQISGGFADVEGLAYDPRTDTLYGLAASHSTIIIIDQNNASATQLPGVALPSAIWRGLTFDTQQQLLYASHVGSSLYTIDPATGAHALVAPITGAGVGFATQGLAHIPSPAPAALLTLAALSRAKRRR